MVGAGFCALVVEVIPQISIGSDLQTLLDRHRAAILIRPAARAYDDAVAVGRELDSVMRLLGMKR